jgi:hypothetical protein
MQTDEAERQIAEAIRTAWRQGWQPRELLRHVRRTTDPNTTALALVAIAADREGCGQSTVDIRWIAQLDAMDLPTAPASGWLREWARNQQIVEWENSYPARALFAAITDLTPLQILIPPPGASADDRSIINLTAKTDDPLLNRVRALLAQAESTNFEAEAETFTAKAQELMTRHAIDMAMVEAGTQRSERPGTIRIPLDEPYISAKWRLLNVVAKSSRCRSVFQKYFAMASVVGFEADLHATETLFTSLLVQAQISMQAASSSAAPGTAARSRSFRSSFLLAYAYRVGERLAAINAHVVADAEAETGQSILPVLAARSSIVDATVSEIFPNLGTMRSRATVDPAGWASGRSAADRAKLNSGDLTKPMPAIG